MTRSLVYSCALLRDILLQGRLYISRNWLCFYANLFGKDIKVSVTSMLMIIAGVDMTRKFMPRKKVLYVLEKIAFF